MIASVVGQPGQKKLSFNPVVAGRSYTITATTWSAITASAPSDNGTTRTITDLNASGPLKFHHGLAYHAGHARALCRARLRAGAFPVSGKFRSCSQQGQRYHGRLTRKNWRLAAGRVTCSNPPDAAGGLGTHCHGEVTPRSGLVCRRVSAMVLGQARVTVLSVEP